MPKYIPRPIDILEAHLEWIPLADLTANADLSCIDGRFRGCGLGAPGGDAGELVLLLGALEAYTGHIFEPDEIERILEADMQRHGRFYMHTDRGALDRLEEAVAAHAGLAEALTRAGGIDALVAAPPVEARPALLDLLVQPQYTGCGHLATMLEHVDEYGVRRRLVEGVIGAFFRLLWSGREQADFDVLEGEHEEQGVVHFATTQPLDAAMAVPSVCGNYDGPHFFLNHDAPRRYKRERDLELLAEFTDVIPEREQQRCELLDAAASLAERQAAATVRYLAPDLPQYEVWFEGRRVRDGGEPPRQQ